MYDKFAAKVNNIDNSDFVLKTKYQTDKTKLETKIPDWVILSREQNSVN